MIQQDVPAISYKYQEETQHIHGHKEVPTKVLAAGKTDLIEGVQKNRAKNAGHVYLKPPKFLIAQLGGFRAWKAGTHPSVCKCSYAPW